MIYNWFVRSKLADDQFSHELITEESYFERLSEMLVAHKLRQAGYSLRNNPAGPDFWAEKGVHGFWVEVVTPRPTRIDLAYIAQAGAFANGELAVPFEDILRRWTSAIHAKAKVLLGDVENNQYGYLQKGLVSKDEAYVIAVNGCQLRGSKGIGFNGVSLKPCAVEALFALGQPYLKFQKNNSEQLRFSGFEHSRRPNVASPNGSPIATNLFLDVEFAPVSAVWALDVDESEVLLDPRWHDLERSYFASAGIFNPLAKNPLQLGSLPTFEDWACEIELDAYRIVHHDRIPFRPIV